MNQSVEIFESFQNNPALTFRHHTVEELSKNKYGDQFDFEGFVDSGRTNLTTFKCRKHGEFEITPKNHMRMQFGGCTGCRDDDRNIQAAKVFKNKAIKKHGKKYTYNENNVYISTKTINIKCVKHDIEFDITAKAHLHSNTGGCPECIKESNLDKRKDKRRLKALSSNKNNFCYKDTDFSNPSSVTVRCIKHGEITLDLHHHLRSEYGGCDDCLREGEHAKTVARYIQSYKNKHGDKYTYDEVKAIDHSLPITITCVKHGSFKVTPKVHLKDDQGGCEGCRSEALHKSKLQEIIKVKGFDFYNRFDYEGMNLSNGHNFIQFKCKEHGVFKTKFVLHMEKPCGGCPQCEQNFEDPDLRKDFISRSAAVFGDKFSYSNMVYKPKTKFTLTCNEHGDFEITEYTHFNSSVGGCPECQNNEKGDLYTKEFIAKTSGIYGNRFTYLDDIIPRSFRAVIRVKCKDHGEFRVVKSHHIDNKFGGCDGCVKAGSIQKIISRFISKSKEIYKDSFDYKQIKYDSNTDLFTIKCKAHKEFSITSVNHYRLHLGGCPDCQVDYRAKRKSANHTKTLAEKFGEFFDYSKTVYVDDHTPYIVTCRKHGDFVIKPRPHRVNLFGGCEKCYQESIANEEPVYKKYLEQIRSVHGNRYEYLNIKKIENKTSLLEIRCLKHGDYTATVGRHLDGQICGKCRLEDNSVKRRDSFIAEAKIKHNDTQDYSLVKPFRNYAEKHVFKCKKHNYEYTQTLLSHLNDVNCKYCVNPEVAQRAIERLANHLGPDFDCSKAEYTGNKNPITVICKLHGETTNIYSTFFVAKFKCRKCGNQNIIRDRQAKFIAEAKLKHNEKYDYSKTKFYKLRIPVTVVCPKHGEFTTIPERHLMGKGGCESCLAEDRHTLSRENWIKLFNQVHDNRYFYTKVPEQIQVRNSISVICIKHGEFTIRPKTHLKKGCKQCEFEKINNLKVIKALDEKFDKRIKIVSQGLYKHKEILTFKCTKHGQFTNHLRNVMRSTEPCPTCREGMTTETFKNQLIDLYGDKFIYTLISYQSKNKKVLLRCRSHGNLVVSPQVLLSGKYECPSCDLINRGLQFKSKVVEVHGDKFKIDLSSFQSYFRPLTVVCKVHGPFNIDVAKQAVTKSFDCPKCLAEPISSVA